MSLFEELKRRNVFRVGIACAVAGWVLLQVADLVLDNVEAPDWVMHVFMLVVFLGFVVSLVIAWAYELTPEGIKREAEVNRDASISRLTAKKLDSITVAAIVLLIAFMILDRFVLERPETASESRSQASIDQSERTGQENSALTPALPTVKDKSIAVLPLVNRSVNPEDAFFAEGMHDEILTRLSRISALRVISRTSMMGYAGTTKRMTEIGRELGVSNILEGGVQRAGDRVRINVQLIEAETDKHLWAEIFDRELTTENLFDIQSEITLAISNALQAVLTGEEQQLLAEKPTENLEAYAHYLRGRAMSLGYGRSATQIMESITAYQSAIEMDPEFAAAYAAMAIDWLEIYWTSAKLGDERDKAFEVLQIAQKLAPGSAETLIAEGYYHYWGFLDYDQAIAAFDKALEREPGNMLALRGKSYAQRRMGRLQDSISNLQLAILLDPMDSQMPADLGFSLLRAGNFSDAEEAFRMALAQNPDNYWNRWAYSEYFLMKGELEAARSMLGPLSEDMAGFMADAYFEYAWLDGDTKAMNEVLVQMDTGQGYPEQGTVARGLLYFSQGNIESFKNELRSAEQGLETSIRNSTDPTTTLSSLIVTYSLLGEKEKLEAGIERFNTELKPDALRLVDNQSIPRAYAVIGDADRLFDYADQMVEEFGPWELHHLVYFPLYEPYRGDPRYKALAQQYDRWLETVQ